MKMLLTFVFFLLIIVPPVYAQSCDTSCGDPDECQRKISKCQEEWNAMEKAKAPHVTALQKMESDIAAFQNRIKGIEIDLVKKAATIAIAEDELSDVLTLASRRIAALYRRTVVYNPLLPFLTSTNVGSILRAFTYQHVVIDEDKKLIAQTAVSIRDLQSRKAQLEKERTTLAGLKADLDRRAASVRKLVGEASAYQTKLSGIIASLSAKQQSFLAAKLSGLNLPSSLGAGPLYCTDDRNLSPGFSPAFAFFTFGIPHRVGMNQYGALGRARAGQNHEQILQAYFSSFSFEERSADIDVQGYGRMPLETYLLGIYEMPGDWPIEALKAQVIAARSYALSYTDNGAKSICTTQSCQVYKGGNKGGAWEEAVKATAKKTMISGGQPVTAWYSSTDGGYTFYNNDVWGGSQRPWTKRMRDTNGDVGSFADLLSRGYDRDSPCFYAAQGFRSEYGKSAWLKSEEVADIANVIQLVKRDGGTREHLYQPDKPNPAGTDTWDRDRVKVELKSRGGTPLTSVSSVSISGVDWGLGRTTGVTISGDGGSVTFDGVEFKDFFNLRAPANIQIVGPLFNVERK
ncbi:MAG TPA: SpoIID/LytB domain-containing protein [Patescibacteria group bacterium]|nr:SpoIID/LytB domain-containing protein [Patescibacteria group bacterium]